MNKQRMTKLVELWFGTIVSIITGMLMFALGGQALMMGIGALPQSQQYPYIFVTVASVLLTMGFITFTDGTGEITDRITGHRDRPASDEAAPSEAE